MKNIWLKNSREKHVNHKDETINNKEIIDMFNRCDILIKNNHEKIIQTFNVNLRKQLDESQ